MGYTRNRSRTPARRSVRPKSFRTAVKDILENSKETKYKNVCLTIDDVPANSLGNTTDERVVNPYNYLLPQTWLTWGHLLSNISVNPNGAPATSYQRAGDEIHMRSLRFDLTLQNINYSAGGAKYRFVVWKTNRARDPTVDITQAMLMSDSSNMAIEGDRAKRCRFAGPPILQTHAVGPRIPINGIDSGNRKPSQAIGNQSQRYPIPVNDEAGQNLVKQYVDCDPVHSIIDTDRCTVLHDEVISIGPKGFALPDTHQYVEIDPISDPPVEDQDATAALQKKMDPGMNIWQGNRNGASTQLTRYITMDKDIEFSTESSAPGVLVGDPMAVKNNNDYVSCALVVMPDNYLPYSASDGVETAVMMTPSAVVRVNCTFKWKDKTISRY